MKDEVEHTSLPKMAALGLGMILVLVAIGNCWTSPPPTKISKSPPAPTRYSPGAMSDLEFCARTNAAGDQGALARLDDQAIVNGACAATNAALTAIQSKDGALQSVCMKAAEHYAREFGFRFSGHSIRELSGKC